MTDRYWEGYCDAKANAPKQPAGDLLLDHLKLSSHRCQTCGEALEAIEFLECLLERRQGENERLRAELATQRSISERFAAQVIRLTDRQPVRLCVHKRAIDCDCEDEGGAK